VPKGKRRAVTPELLATICAAIADGNTRVCAAQAVGQSERWFHDQLASNAEFAAAIEKADAEAEQRMVRVISSAAPKEWTAAAWWLERRRHEAWGRKDRQQQDIHLSGGVQVQFIPALPREGPPLPSHEPEPGT